MTMKSYRFFGEEAEALGRRLDHARTALARFENASEGEWGVNFWQRTIDQLLFQWRNLPALHDSEAQVSLIPRWEIKYDYYERDDGVRHNDFTDKIVNKFFREPDLEGSWNRNIERRLAKCQ